MTAVALEISFIMLRRARSRWMRRMRPFICGLPSVSLSSSRTSCLLIRSDLLCRR